MAVADCAVQSPPEALQMSGVVVCCQAASRNCTEVCCTVAVLFPAAVAVAAPCAAPPWHVVEALAVPVACVLRAVVHEIADAPVHHPVGLGLPDWLCVDVASAVLPAEHAPAVSYAVPVAVVWKVFGAVLQAGVGVGYQAGAGAGAGALQSGLIVGALQVAVSWME